MSTTHVELVCDALGDVTVLDVDGREAMDALSLWTVRVFAAEAVDTARVMRSPATLVLVDPAEQTERRVRLLVTDVTCEIERGRDRVYTLALSDPPWLLTRRGGHRLFTEKTTEQIVTEVLRDAGIPADAIVPRLASSYPVRLQCVAYGESEWAFITRLLADDGISFWFETHDGAGRIVFGDAPGSHEGLEGGATLRYVGPTGALAAGGRAITALAWEEQVTHDQVLLRDFDVRQPDVYVDGRAGEGEFYHFEYPAGVPTTEAASARAQRRLEQLQREQVVVTGETDCIRLQPGRLMEIQGSVDEIFEQRMLIAEVRHRFARPTRDSGRSIAYGNHVSLRPTRSADGAARPHHRPALPIKPALEHLDSAIVTGASGEEIHVDDLGRVKLRFLWDRAGIKDDRSSHWVRCLQYPLGASMFLPRVGWEVTVGFLDGSPDTPFVLGRLYNATAVTPYSLPAASATTAFQSWTTPKSGMTQEIKMSDVAGQQQMAIHASKDLSVKVGGSRKTSVGGDMDHSVGISLTSNVLGSRSVDVGAMQTLDVAKEILLSVGGASSESISAAEIISVSGNRGLSAGASCVELVGAGYTVLCNQSNVKVDGVSTQAVLGNKSIAAGLGITESVAAARGYVCLGNRTVSCGAYAESIYGGKRSKAGVVNENAAGIGAAAPSWTVKPGTLSVTAAGKITLSAPVVSIDVSGSLTAGPLSMSGGALKTTSGMFAVNGNTSRPRGGQVGS